MGLFSNTTEVVEWAPTAKPQKKEFQLRLFKTYQKQKDGSIIPGKEYLEYTNDPVGGYQHWQTVPEKVSVWDYYEDKPMPVTIVK